MEPDVYQPDAAAEDEPRYLRRQKPVEIRRRKFNRQARRQYGRMILAGAVVLAAAGALYLVGSFLWTSPQVALVSPEQIAVSGNRVVSRAAVIEKFYPDRERSVLRVPLEERRAALEQIPWVERATVRRVLPNRIEVELVERTPVAFLRLGHQLALVDAYGVILDRPPDAAFELPVVTGLTEAMPRGERERRMHMFVQFLEEIGQVRPEAPRYVSEADLADAANLRAVLAGLPELGQPRQGGQPAVVVQFGDRAFRARFRQLVENLPDWRARAGRMESIDLRFDRQVVVNPEAQP
jgi:cell division protein FtsQ